MIAVLVMLMVGLVSAEVVCPDGKKCPDRNTCCSIKTGYACCPYPSAICCPDKSHCCPGGFQCNGKTEMCEKKELPWFTIPFTAPMPTLDEEKTAPALLVQSQSPSVVRCDSISFCSDGTTCCRSPRGQWSCCPYTLGQCCNDGIHCCPHGYHCDRSSIQCLRGKLSIPASPQIDAMPSNIIQMPPVEEEKPVPAPLVKSTNPSVVFCDSNSFCPDGTTCCRFSFRRWTCCIYILGQCCIDGIHCCPFLYHCDFTSTRCFRGTLSIPASPQIPAIQSNTIQNQDAVIHCNDRFYCPAGYSCCKSPTGQLACCPYPLGQCCQDGKHCCEYGFDCDPTSSKCKKGYISVPARLTKEALLR